MHFLAGASINFSDGGGGGGGGKSKEIVKKTTTKKQRTLRSRNIELCAQNWKFCMFSKKYFVKINGFVVPDSAF